jgi:hypothetical protein
MSLLQSRPAPAPKRVPPPPAPSHANHAHPPAPMAPQQSGGMLAGKSIPILFSSAVCIDSYGS